MFATVTVQPDNPAAKPRTERISARVKVAIEAMVDGGLNRADAAKHAGLLEHSLYVALTKPHVLAYRSERLRVIRTSETARTIHRIAKLADSATSEHVQLDANKFLAGSDPYEPITPTTKSESTINHKGLGPGLTIIMAQPELARVIDSQAHQVEYVSREKHLSAPVPHPSMGTRQSEAANLRGNQPPDREGVGEKPRRRR